MSSGPSPTFPLRPGGCPRAEYPRELQVRGAIRLFDSCFRSRTRIRRRARVTSPSRRAQSPAERYERPPPHVCEQHRTERNRSDCAKFNTLIPVSGPRDPDRFPDSGPASLQTRSFDFGHDEGVGRHCALDAYNHRIDVGFLDILWPGRCPTPKADATHRLPPGHRNQGAPGSPGAHCGCGVSASFARPGQRIRGERSHGIRKKFYEDAARSQHDNGPNLPVDAQSHDELVPGRAPSIVRLTPFNRALGRAARAEARSALRRRELPYPSAGSAGFRPPRSYGRCQRKQS